MSVARSGSAHAPSFRGPGLLWTALAVLPWLLPTRTFPWTTFYADALAGAVWLLLALSLLAGAAKSSQPVPQHAGVALDILPALALALALVAGLQAAAGRLVFASEAVLPAAYLVAFAGAALLGRHCREAFGESFTDHLWAGLLAAALLSAGIGVAQWLQVEPLGWLTPLAEYDGRAIANVGQANNLATLLCWGLIALWRARLAARLGPACTALAAAFLVFALVLTQSRTPWLGAVVIFAITARGRHALGGRRALWALTALVACYVAVSWALAPVSVALGLTPPRTLADHATAGLRPTIWAICLEAIAERPWLGWGWNQIVVAWVALAPGRLPMPDVNGYSHNLVLDLLLWNGVVIGGLVLIGLFAWLWRVTRAARTAEQWLLLAGVGVFGVHAMLELPYAYLLMLLPVAAMMGALSATTAMRPLVRVRRRWVAGSALALAALLVLVVHDYQGIEADLQAMRLRDAGIIARTPHVPSQPIVLRWMAEADAVLMPRSPESLTAQDMVQLRTTLTRFPHPGGLARYAQAAALRGDTADAAWALRALCGLHRRIVCEPALREWQQFASRHPGASSIPLPPLPEL